MLESETREKEKLLSANYILMRKQALEKFQQDESASKLLERKSLQGNSHHQNSA